MLCALFFWSCNFNFIRPKVLKLTCVGEVVGDVCSWREVPRVWGSPCPSYDVVLQILLAKRRWVPRHEVTLPRHSHRHVSRRTNLLERTWRTKQYRYFFKKIIGTVVSLCFYLMNGNSLPMGDRNSWGTSSTVLVPRKARRSATSFRDINYRG